MGKNLRKSIRYEDFGRAECDEICPMPGILDDISATGCKIHYDAPISLNMENDYEIRIRLSRFSAEPMVLMCHPQWQDEAKDGTSSIGFEFLHSLDTARLEQYIQQLSDEKASSEIDSILPQEDSCQFV